jgi:hypothetical protein
MVFVILWAGVFFLAFMTAFGNDSPAAQVILHGAAAFFVIANPLWGIPAAYCAGALIGARPGSREPSR